MRFLGRLLQWFGLALLPFLMLLELNKVISLPKMLLLMVSGLAGFYLGRIIEGYAGK